MSVMMTYIVWDQTCSSLSGLTKNIVLLYCLTTKLDFFTWKMYLLNSQPSYVWFKAQAIWEQNIILSLSVDYPWHVFRINVPWPGGRRACHRHSVSPFCCFCWTSCCNVVVFQFMFMIFTLWLILCKHALGRCTPVFPWGLRHSSGALGSTKIFWTFTMRPARMFQMCVCLQLTLEAYVQTTFTNYICSRYSYCSFTIELGNM